VLADALGSWGTRTSFWTRLEERGVEVRLFHSLVRHPLYQAFRDHRKILVVDRRVAFTGGMNIGDEYVVGEVGVGAWRDTHLKVTGPPAWEMAVVFVEGWRRAGGAPIVLPPLAADFSPGAPVLVLDSRPGRGHSESAAVLGAIVGAARERLWITNSYFAPRRGVVDLLGAARRRGVDVRLLLPGPTDVPLVRHAGHGFYDALLCRGVRLYEYQRSVLHAKSLVTDGYVSVVGSSNLDYRSFRFNAECNLVLLEENVARGLERAFLPRGSRGLARDRRRLLAPPPPSPPPRRRGREAPRPRSLRTRPAGRSAGARRGEGTTGDGVAGDGVPP
jgi:cardiolipin synthase